MWIKSARTPGAPLHSLIPSNSMRAGGMGWTKKWRSYNPFLSHLAYHGDKTTSSNFWVDGWNPEMWPLNESYSAVFHMVLLIWFADLTLESLDEILSVTILKPLQQYVHISRTIWPIYLMCTSNFWVCGRNPKVWPFKWNLFSSTFARCYSSRKEHFFFGSFTSRPGEKPQWDMPFLTVASSLFRRRLRERSFCIKAGLEFNSKRVLS